MRTSQYEERGIYLLAAIPEEQARAIKEIPRDPDTVALFIKISGPDPLPR
jgi:hypothetical protein